MKGAANVLMLLALVALIAIDLPGHHLPFQLVPNAPPQTIPASRDVAVAAGFFGMGTNSAAAESWQSLAIALGDDDRVCHDVNAELRAENQRRRTVSLAFSEFIGDWYDTNAPASTAPDGEKVCWALTEFHRQQQLFHRLVEAVDEVYGATNGIAKAGD